MGTTENISAECGLEPEDFRIDSSGWTTVNLRNGTRVKRNPEGDVTELLEGPYAGCQHFSFEAALRETAKAGKRMPTKEEWAEAINAVNPSLDEDGAWHDGTPVGEALGLKLAGYRTFASSRHNLQGSFGNYWASSSSGSYGYVVAISHTEIFQVQNPYKVIGFSVRCMKD